MKNETYPVPFEDLLRSTLSILNKMQFDAIYITGERDKITAKRHLHWYGAKITLRIIIIKLDENSTKFSIAADEEKSYFFNKLKGQDYLEEDFISKLNAYKAN